MSEPKQHYKGNAMTFARVSKRSYVSNNLKFPKDDLQLILYEMLQAYDEGCTRYYLTSYTKVKNLTPIFKKMEALKIGIDKIKVTEKRKKINVTYLRYKLKDFEASINAYKTLTNDN